jgi:putative DNA primase/helicase
VIDVDAMIVEEDSADRKGRNEARLNGLQASGAAGEDFALISAAKGAPTEGNLAGLLVSRFGDRLRFVDKEAWAFYDGVRWVRDSELQTRALMQQIVRELYAGAAAASGEGNREALAKYAIKADKKSFQAGALSLAEPRLKALRAEFDADPELLNLTNGTLDLQTGELRDHNPNDHCSRVAPVGFDPTADCPVWRAALEVWQRGDQERISFLQRLVGYLLLADNSDHKLPIITGPGRNGKTTFVETVQALLGKSDDGGYSTTISLDTLLEALRHRDGSHHTDDVAALAGCRAAFANESMKGRKLDSARVKSLTGGDTISARKIFSSQFRFQNKARLVLSTNHLPRVDGDDPALEQRLAIVPFDVVIPEDQRDRNMPRRLLAELPGILNWALVGLAEWRRKGLGTSSVVRQKTTEYMRREDPAGRFIEEKCRAVEGIWTPRSDLRDAWTEFLREEGINVPLAGADAQPLYEALRYRDFEEKKRKGNPGFAGLELVPRVDQ